MDGWDELAEMIARPGNTPRARAARAAIETMRLTLGEEWLAEGWVPPELALAFSHTIAFAQLLELALRLSSFREAPGAGVIRQGLRSNRTTERWRHVQLQLELAALAGAVGADAKFETRSEHGWPADVVLEHAHESVAFETFAVFTSDEWRAATGASDEISDRLFALELKHHLSLVVDFQGENLSPKELESWLRGVEQAADLVVSDGREREVTSGQVRARLARNDSGPPSSFRGPPITANPWRRIVRKLDAKREQVSANTDSVWLRVDLLEGMWQFSEWARAPLPEKLAVMRDYLRAEFTQAAGLAGIVVSSGAAWAQGRFDDEDAVADDGSIALRRNLRPLRVRETLIIPLRSSATSGTVDLLRNAYTQEPESLDLAIREAGLGTLDEVFSAAAGLD